MKLGTEEDWYDRESLGLGDVLSVGLARHAEALGEGDDLGLEGGDLLVGLEGLGEVDEFLGREAGLDGEAELNGLVKEVGDGDEVRLDEAARGHRGRADPDAARGEGGDVARDRVLVEGDLAEVAYFFHFGSRDASGTQIPEHEVIVGAARRERVAVVVDEALPEGADVRLDLLYVGLVLGRGRLPELHGDARYLVLVRPALQRREDRVVHEVLEVAAVLLEENNAGSRPAQRLVGRGGDDVAVLERVVGLAGRDQARDVGHVHHQQRAVRVGDRAEARVVPVARVRGAAADDERGFEEPGELLEFLKVDQAGLRVDLVRQRLEVDGGRRDGLAVHRALVERVKAVRQVAARGQVQAHDPVVRLQQRRVDGEVRGRAGVRLDVAAPLSVAQAVRLEGARLAEVLDLVDDFVSAVVSLPRQPLRVLVRQARPEAVHHGARREVLRGDQLDRGELPLLLALQELEDLAVDLLNGFSPGCAILASSTPLRRLSDEDHTTAVHATLRTKARIIVFRALSRADPRSCASVCLSVIAGPSQTRTTPL
eukprot:CAMPEP_0197394282 /NCGR_PEP_ID=MMETSP1165-20131217/4790_1 /TAXON_ID=284809 /ORGANISM="Chrysocystis fragilis, Strain CCMP3189" /LENGTH=540 /DNA_ID=CAMNT_0042919969 /DNA_START=357 /DNA_END=1978 /DNA_ORIENTATION=-